MKTTGADVDDFAEKLMARIREIGGVAYRDAGVIKVRWHRHLYHLEVSPDGPALAVDVERS